MNFICVTDYRSGLKIYVNKDKIISIEDYGNECCIDVGKENPIPIRESVDYVMSFFKPKTLNE